MPDRIPLGPRFALAPRAPVRVDLLRTEDGTWAGVR